MFVLLAMMHILQKTMIFLPPDGYSFMILTVRIYITCTLKHVH